MCIRFTPCNLKFTILTYFSINKLIIILESIERKEKKTFKLNLMDIEEENYTVEPIQFPYLITLPSQDFHKYCKDMAASTDKIEIKATSNKLFFSYNSPLFIIIPPLLVGFKKILLLFKEI
mgnify:CR=1 FL=1